MTIYKAPKKLTIEEFKGLDPYDPEKGAQNIADRFALASSVLRHTQFDSSNHFNYKGRWAKVREAVILRNGPYDFITGELIEGPVIVHHLNEITANSTLNEIFDEDALVPVSQSTHQQLHWVGSHQKQHKKPDPGIPPYLRGLQ